MGDIYTTGSWKPSAGSEDAFVEAWKAFAGWACGQPGAGTLRLVRDLHEPGRFVSFGAWDSIDEVRAWKQSPEFRERMAQVIQHVEVFEPTELELVAAAGGGSLLTQSAASVLA
jgi:heme-degrading monooxygenase HmoA